MTVGGRDACNSVRRADEDRITASRAASRAALRTIWATPARISALKRAIPWALALVRRMDRTKSEADAVPLDCDTLACQLIADIRYFLRGGVFLSPHCCAPCARDGDR